MSRKSIQLANDLVKFVNVINDLCDVAAWYLQDIDPADGSTPVQYREGDPVVVRESTVADLKSEAQKCYQGILTYHTLINRYRDAVAQSVIVDALSDIGIVAAELLADLNSMKTHIQYVKDNISAATTKPELAVLGAYLDTNVPKLELLRRPWTVEG